MQSKDSIKTPISVNLLDGLFPEHDGWQSRRAGKDHVDVFGQDITRGDMHFVRRFSGIDDFHRISAKSMEIVLGCIFGENPKATMLAQRTINSRHTAVVTALDTDSDQIK